MVDNIIKPFISYAHKDKEYFDVFIEGFNSHINTSKNYKWEPWTDKNLFVGDFWNLAIQKNLNDCNMAILLVSVNFMNSQYIEHVEFQKFLDRYRSEGILIFPIMFAPCDFSKWDELSKRQFFMPNGDKFDKRGIDDFTYADLISFNPIDHTVTKNPNRDRYHIELIKEAERSFAHFRKSIPPKVKETKEIVEVNSGDEKIDLLEAVKVFNLEAAKINFDSSKEEIQKAEELKTKLIEQITGNYEAKKLQIPSISKKVSSLLFDKIYSSEILSSPTLEEIRKIRDEKQTYFWHDRSIIVSALSLSLIQFKQFDQKKADLLIDFITDFEDNVWQNALVGLILPLIYHRNKWLRFPQLTTRLKVLKDLKQVQIGLWSISFLTTIEHYKKSMIPKGFQDEGFFSDPVNCFKPFYKGNQILETAFETIDSDFDFEDFEKWIFDIPLQDIMKYAITLNISDLNKTSSDKKKLSKNALKTIINHLHISREFEPYANILSSYYAFFNFYPQKKIDDLFKKQLDITETKLKEIILDKKNELRISAIQLMEKDSFSTAIHKWNALLEIEPKNKMALSNIAICYINLKSPDYKQALNIYLRIESYDPENLRNLENIGEAYYNLNQYDDAKRYYYKILGYDSTNENAFWELGNLAFVKNNFEEAITNFKKCLDINSKSAKGHQGLALVYYEKGERENALVEIDIAIELDDDIYAYYGLKASILLKLKKFELAIESCDKAISLSQSNPHPKIYEEYIERGEAYYRLNKFNESSRDYEKAIRISKNDPAAFHLRSHSFANIGEYEKAMIDINKAIEIKDDYALAYNSRAALYLSKGNIQKAKEDLNKAMEIDKEDGYFFGTLALINSAEEDDEKFYLNLEIAIQKNAIIKDYFHKTGFKRYWNQPRFIELLKKYNIEHKIID